MQIYPEKYDKLELSTSERSFLRTMERSFPDAQLAYYVLQINPRKRDVGKGQAELFSMLVVTEGILLFRFFDTDIPLITTTTIKAMGNSMVFGVLENDIKARLEESKYLVRESGSLRFALNISFVFPNIERSQIEANLTETEKEFCDKHNLWLVEDNCDALGTKYTIDGVTKFSGTWGDIGTSSFYPPHHMTMGEGGCVYTDNPLLNKIVRSFRDWGRDCVCPSGRDNFCGHRFDGQYGELPAGYDHKYVYSHLGYNLKVTDMQAAVGVEQLKKFPTFIERRKENWAYLRKALSDLEDKLILPEAAENSEPSWFGFLISVKPESGFNRNDVTKYIESKNVQTRLLFSGNLTLHPCFDSIRGTDAYRVASSLDVTNYIMNNSFWIGVYPGMTEEKLAYMSKVIHEALS